MPSTTAKGDADRVEVTYYLPTFGEVGAALTGRSAELFSALAPAEISRLKRTPQLGIVPQAWEGARHTRWEYIVLTLLLIERASQLPSVRVGSNVRLHGGESVTASDLLKCWAFLLNVGHLEWTFSSEKVLFDEIARCQEPLRTNLTNELLRRVPEGAPREWAADVVATNAVYQYHQILAFFRMRRLTGDKDLRQLWASMLATYVSSGASERQSITALRAVFKRVRKLAFLTLDSEYTPSVIHLNLGKMLNDSRALARLLDIHASSDELSSLEEYLDSHVYSGREVMLAEAKRVQGLRERVARELRMSGLRGTVEQLATGQLPVKVREDLTEVVRVRINLQWLQPPFGRGADLLGRPRQIEESVARWAAREGGDVQLIAQVNGARDNLVLQAHAEANDQHSRACAIAIALRYGRVMLTSRQDSDLNAALMQIFQRNVGSHYAQAIVSSALDEFLADSLRWDWDAPLAGARAGIGSMRTLRAFAAQLQRDTPLSRSRAHELGGLLEVLGHLRPRLAAAALVNLKGYGDAPTPAVELDGVGVTFDRARRDLVLTVTESKHQRTGSEGAARKALVAKTKVLGFSPGVHVGRVQTKRQGSKGLAWRHLRIRLDRLP